MTIHLPLLNQLKICVPVEKIPDIKKAIQAVKVSDSVLDYAQRLVYATRDDTDILVGLSPRGAMALLKVAKAWAFMHERGHLIPEDIQQVFMAAVSHRLIPKQSAYLHAAETLAQKILVSTPVVPR